MKQLINQIPEYICDKGDESYVIYSDTDSIYIHAHPLLKHLYPDFDKWDDKEKDNKSISVSELESITFFKDAAPF